MTVDQSSTAVSFATRQAATALQLGGVIAYPTEAVWGLGCDPWDPEAVMRLLALKQRPVEKGFILVAGCESQLEFLLADLSPALRSKLSLSWPGASTWLVPHNKLLPNWVYGEHDTVALRVTDHPVVRQLCQACGGPIISTSANPAGCQPAVAQFQVQRYFGAELDAITAGWVGGNKRPSVIRDLLSDRVIRA